MAATVPPGAEAGRPPSRAPAVLCGGAAVALLLLVLVLACAWPKDDVSWFLYLAGRLLAGERLYVDRVDVNPPLMVLLSVPAAWLAPRLGLRDTTVQLVATAALLATSAWCTALLSPRRLRGDPLPVAAAVVGVLALAAGAEFGQREQLHAALVLPYLALAVRRWEGGTSPAWAALAAGAAAGLGFAVKPHFLLAPVLLEAAGARRRVALVRAETLAAAGVLAGYGVVVALAFREYLTEVMPLATLYWHGYGSRWYRVVVGAAPLLLLAIADRILYRRRPTAAPVVPALLAMAAAGGVAYLVQWKGWHYQTLPCAVPLALAGLWMARQEWPERGRSLRLLAGSALLASTLIVPAVQGFARARDKQVAVGDLMRLLREHRARSLWVLSRSLSPAFPAVDWTGVRWVSRFDTTWLLGVDSGLPSAERWRRALIADFVAAPPRLLVVDLRRGRDDLLALAAEPEVARELQAYREVGGMSGFRVLLRRRSCGLPGGASRLRPDHQEARKTIPSVCGPATGATASLR